MSAPVHAIASLKAALRASLLADGDLSALIGAAVFDAPPRGTAPPYLVLSDALGRQNGGLDAEAALIDLDLVVVTSERGTASALGIAAAVEQALKTAPGPLDDHHLVGLETRQIAIRHDPATSLTRATLRLRAFVEPL